MNIIERRELGTVASLDIAATLTPDVDATPYEADCYSSADRIKWNTGQWCFVIITVTASLDSHELGSASLGGVECGDLDRVTVNPLDDEHPIKSHDMVAAAVAEAKQSVAALVASEPSEGTKQNPRS